LRVAEDDGGQPCPVEPALLPQHPGPERIHHPGQALGSGFDHFTGQRIGIDDNCSEFAQARCHH
jgi:hypothetical protein